MTTEREIALRVALRLRAAGHDALFAGGCVRDHLRGVDPKDYDIATSARPEEVQALFPHTVAVGAAFGVVLVIEEEHQFEVATFREDVGILDGRHPEQVRYADAKADALRRDFTINGMFEDPGTGEVLDFVGGREDLRARCVRSIGDPTRRYAEDRLRMLRAVRFATTLEFTLEPATMRAIRADAAAIQEVSAERIRDELIELLTSGHGGRGIGLLLESGLLDEILPEVAAMGGVAQPSQFHPEGDVLTHTRMLLDGFRGEGEAVALAALLHDVGKPPTATINDKGRIAFPNHAPVGAEMSEEILRRLRFPNRIIEQVTHLIARHMDWGSLPLMRAAKQRRFLLREDFPLHLELHRLDCEACHRDFDLHRFAILERARLQAEPPPVKPLINGHDLMTLGFEAGPGLGRILEALLDAQLEERVATREQAVSFVKDGFAVPDGRPIAEESRS